MAKGVGEICRFYIDAKLTIDFSPFQTNCKLSNWSNVKMTKADKMWKNQSNFF